MTPRAAYRFAIAMVVISAVLLVPAFIFGSTFTRAAFVVALVTASAAALVFRPDRKNAGGAR